ncbi:hypothetical protein TcCL_ESM07996, partial [Trypanosoma cruzi]
MSSCTVSGPLRAAHLEQLSTTPSQMAVCLAPGIRWKLFPFPNLGKGPYRPESYRPIKSLSVLFKLTKRMIHRRLSAILPHHPRQFGFTPSRSKSDVVTIVIDQINRGLNEFSTVEYEHPGGGA